MNSQELNAYVQEDRIEIEIFGFCGGRNPDNPEKYLQSKDENQKQIQPTYDAKPAVSDLTSAQYSPP